MLIVMMDNIVHFRTTKELGDRACSIFKNNPLSVWGWVLAPTPKSDFDHDPWSSELVELVNWRDVLHDVLPFIELLPGVVGVGVVRQRITVAIDIIFVAIGEAEFVCTVFQVKQVNFHRDTVAAELVHPLNKIRLGCRFRRGLGDLGFDFHEER